MKKNSFWKNMQNAVVNIILLFFSNFDRGLQKAPLHTQPTLHFSEIGGQFLIKLSSEML